MHVLVRAMKQKILKYPTEPLEVWPERKISELTDGMLWTGFQGRKLAEVIEVWARMLRKRNVLIWFGLAGAMVPAGMRRVVSYLIKRRMVDAVVSTGANLYHDAYEAYGRKHYIGSHLTDDVKLRKYKVDRIYDVFADEAGFYKFDNWIEKSFSYGLRDNYPYSSRELMFLLGKTLSKVGRERDSILVSAYRKGVPIFCPALNDSAIGFSIMFANRKGRKVKVGKTVRYIRKRILIDALNDVEESSRITEKAKLTGVVYLGGGVPKNFIQQTAVIASYQTRHDRSHNYAVQITTDPPHWGGLSGGTFEEAQSWGKIHRRAGKVTCFADATIALPIVVHALSEKFKRLRREVPVFEWGKNGELKLSYETMRL